jgi:PAS domain S-box-containing protein
LIEAMLSLMPDAAIVVDGAGTITHTNDALATLFGYSDDELLGRPIETLVPERFRAEHRTDRANYSKAPGTRAMGAGLPLFGRRCDGTEFPVDISLAPFEAGDGRAIVAAVRDISDRREAEVERAQMAAIIESSGDAIFAMSIEGTVQSWNPGGQDTLGFTAADVVGAHVSRLYPDDASLDLEEQLSIARRGISGGTRDSEWLTREGIRLPVAVRVSPLRAGGDEVTGFSVVVRDITERKQAEHDLRRLLAEGERNARWQSAMAEIRLRVLDGVPLTDVLELICSHLIDLMGGKGAAVALGQPSQLAVSVDVDAHLLTQVDLGELDRLAARASLHRADTLDPRLGEALGGEHVLVVPIGVGDDRSGYLLCAMGHSLADADMSVALSLAEQAALATELDRARVDRELLLIGDERERIARDLHDLAIQRLFASGLSVQSVLPLVQDERAAARLSGVVQELDETIREIRGTIFTLAPPVHATAGLRLELMALVAETSRSLGFEPATHFDGPVDSAVGPVDRAHVTAVVREALSNVARHASAASVSIDVTVRDGQLTVSVTDDGVGLHATDRQSGLRNLRSRAEERGGTFALDNAPGGGTRLRWQVPVG